MLLVFLAAFGYLVPVGSRTFTPMQALPFVLTGVGFGALAAAFLGLAFVRGAPAATDEVLFDGEGGCLVLVLGVPLLVGSGGMVALGLADLLGGSPGGLGAVCVGPVLFLPAAILVGSGMRTFLAPDGAVRVERGTLWRRVRVIPREERKSVEVRQHSNRGQRFWNVEVVTVGGERVSLGGWRDPEAAKRMAARVISGR